MKLVSKDYQIFNQEDSSQAVGALRQLYALERTLQFENSFLTSSKTQKALLSLDTLLRIAIIFYAIAAKQMSDEVSLGLAIIGFIQTSLNIIMNMYFYSGYASSRLLGKNVMTKTILNVVSQCLQLDMLFFLSQCEANKSSEIETAEYEYSTLQYLYFKRLAVAARIHVIVFCIFYLQSEVDAFVYLVFILSIVLHIYYNHLNSNTLISSSEKQSQGLLEKTITNIELALQFVQSLLFTLYLGSTSLAWVVVFLPSTTILFSLLSFIDNKLIFEPHTIGVIEFVFLGSNTCHLMPVLKNDFAMAQLYLAGVLKMFYLIVFIVVQAVIQGMILSVNREQMPEGIFELQVVLLAILTPVMLIKFFKISKHFFEQTTIQTASLKDINPISLKNRQKVVLNYQNKSVLSNEDVQNFELLIQKNIRQYFIDINNSFYIQSYHGHVYLTINSMKDAKNLQKIYTSLLKHSKTLSLNINFNGQKYNKELVNFFIFVLKNRFEPEQVAVATFDITQLLNYIHGNNKAKNIINFDDVLNFSTKSMMEYIAFEQHFQNTLYNNHHQVYYDLFEDV